MTTRTAVIEYDEIRAIAEPIGNGWSEAKVTLPKGGRAWAPGTTKYDLLAHKQEVVVTYRFAPDGGAGAYPDGPVSRTLKDGKL